MPINTDKLSRLPLPVQRSALETLWAKATDEAARAEVSTAAQALGFARAADGFERVQSTASPKAAHVLKAAEGQLLSHEQLRSLIGVPAVFRVRLTSGEHKTVAGTLGRVDDYEPVHFSTYDVRAAEAAATPEAPLLIVGNQRLRTTGIEVFGIDWAAPLSALKLEGAPGESAERSAKVGLGQDVQQMLASGQLNEGEPIQDARELVDAMFSQGVVASAALDSKRLAGIKREQNALVALLLNAATKDGLPELSPDEAWRRASLRERLPAGLEAYERLNHRVREALLNALERALLQPTPLVAKAQQRLDALTLYQTQVGLSYRSPGSRALIEAGAATAGVVFASIARQVPALFEQRFGRAGTRDELLQVFRQSQTLVRELAHADLAVIGWLFQEGAQASPNGYVDLTDLELTGEGASLRVDLSQAARERLEQSAGGNFKTRQSGTTGCPAMARVDGPMVIDVVGAKVAELLEAIYEREAQVRHHSGRMPTS